MGPQITCQLPTSFAYDELPCQAELVAAAAPSSKSYASTTQDKSNQEKGFQIDLSSLVRALVEGTHKNASLDPKIIWKKKHVDFLFLNS